MIPGLVDLFTGADGKLYGIVWNNDTRFFFYNADMLKRAGIAQPPRTWDELVSQSKTLMSKGIAKFGLAGFWKAEWALMNDFHFFIYTYGGQIVDRKGNLLFNKDPNTLAAMQEMVKLLKEGVMDPASSPMTRKRSTTSSSREIPRSSPRESPASWLMRRIPRNPRSSTRSRWASFRAARQASQRR